MLKSIIVDDEFKSRESLKALIEKFCESIEVATLCQNGDEAIRAIAEYKPDIVFLDIQLQRESGFDILEKLDKVEFEIIFTTAYSEFAVRAFKFSAIDYLLKPVDVNDLRNAVEKARKRILGNISERMNQLAQTIKGNTFKHSRLAVPSSEGLVFVSVDNILYCEASGNYTNIHMSDGRKFVVSRTLKEYEEMLDGLDFFRIHNSFLINLHLIKKYIRGEGGQVVMTNDQALDVSKAKKKSFLEKIKIKE
ncbi:MAG TPA: LytTR family DNA-binding domain-containing protein [Chryseosolibacter sp.]